MLRLLLAVPLVAWLIRFLFRTADWTAPITWTSVFSRRTSCLRQRSRQPEHSEFKHPRTQVIRYMDCTAQGCPTFFQVSI